jgi:hypothetical protein
MRRPMPPAVETVSTTPSRALTLTRRGARDFGRLAAVTCHFNPCGYRRLRENYFRFREALRGCPLYTIEVSFDGTFYLPSDWQVRADERHLMWQKEQLINVAIARLPDRYEQVAWIDADLLFLNDRWAEQTSDLLQKFSVLQLFENFHYLSPRGTFLERFPSLMRKRREKLDGHGQPGGAWAARRDFVARHGLYPYNAVGGGDQVFVDGLFGAWENFLNTKSPPKLVQHWQCWQRGVWQDIRGQVGCTDGDALHLFHGTLTNRQYVERTAMLRESDFDPSTDVRIGANGLLEWTSHKPQLQRALREYFAARREDE